MTFCEMSRWDMAVVVVVVRGIMPANFGS